MIIVGLTDLHGRLPDIDRLKKILDQADLVLIVGDITNFGRRSEADLTVAPIIENSKIIMAVSGNCDYKEVDEYLTEKRINLHARAETRNNIKFVGLGGSLITPFGTPNELTEEQIAQALKKAINNIPDAMPMVLVSHQPPYQTRCDKLSSGDHVGSISVRKFIEQYQPLVCFTGHIHEAASTDKIGDTHIINPGQLVRGGYAYAEITDGKVSAEIRRV